MEKPSEPNPYAAPQSEAVASASAQAKGRPRRDWVIWATTVSVLTMCAVCGLVGASVVLVWLGAPVPGFLAGASGSRLLEPIGAGGLNIVVVAFAFAYGQIKAVWLYDTVWARTVAWALLIGSATLLLGALLLSGTTTAAGVLVFPAAGALALGLCMLEWHRKLRLARLAAPRSLAWDAATSHET